MIRNQLGLTGALVLAGCFSPSNDPLESGLGTGGCPIGSETCPCTAAGTCDPGLVCRSELCVADVATTGNSSDTEGTGSGDAEGTGSSDGADGSTTLGTTSGSDSSTGDPCGGLCGEDQACIDGECMLTCAPGEIICDDECIDPLTNMDHCGAVGSCLGDEAGMACDPTPSSPCPGALGEACQAGACAPACLSDMQSFAYSGSIEQLLLPACVAQIHVVASGAQGGSSSNGSAGGLGATVEGDVCVSPGTTLSILVGEQAESTTYPCGGGGGSYVVDGMTPLFVAGGGGGGYNDWTPGGDADVLAVAGPGIGGTAHNDAGGGGGFTFNGAGTMGTEGSSFLNGGMGGVDFPLDDPETGRGGFGGGGGSSQSTTFNAGGGGGYDGGNAGNGNSSTGGSSWTDPAVAGSVFTPADRMGHGNVEISW